MSGKKKTYPHDHNADIFTACIPLRNNQLYKTSPYSNKSDVQLPAQTAKKIRFMHFALRNQNAAHRFWRWIGILNRRKPQELILGFYIYWPDQLTCLGVSDMEKHVEYEY